MRLSKQEHSIDQRPALRAEQIEGANAAVLTITGVRSGNIPDIKAPGGSRFTVRISVEEFPDHQFYCNPAGVTALIEKYGEEDQDWIGQQLPVVVKNVQNPVSKRWGSALHVAPLNEWEGVLDGTGAVDTTDEPAKPAPKPAAKRAPAKKTTRAR